MVYLASALAMGFFAGGHCLGMCGPLVLALPVNPVSHARSVIYRIVYNSGRVVTYTLLGAVVGLAGITFSLRGWQTKVSYIAGGLLIVFSLIQLMPFFHAAFFTGIHARMLRFFSAAAKQPGALRSFVLGGVNGFLPCGMVTAALAASLAAAEFYGSALYMLFFGLGTFPVMLIASLFGMYMSPAAKRVLSFIGPLYGLGLGILLILRPSLMLPHCH